VRVKGQFAPGGKDTTFRLFRMKMTCCAADAYPLNVEIRSPTPLSFEKLQGKWVNATGRVRFEKPAGSDDFATALEMRSANDVKETRPDANPFLQ
jgi:uncharacterized membrane protein YcgQ (UPF0703/DUF1980 family)